MDNLGKTLKREKNFPNLELVEKNHLYIPEDRPPELKIDIFELDSSKRDSIPNYTLREVRKGVIEVKEYWPTSVSSHIYEKPSKKYFRGKKILNRFLEEKNGREKR